jgi:hypothetical protein
MKHLNYVLFITSTLFLGTCTIFKKDVKKPVIVKIVAPQTYASLGTSVNYLKYVVGAPSDYEIKFMDNLISEGKLTHNITINNESPDPDYIIEVKGLSITESEFSQTVSDAASPYNGQTFFLNKVEANCNVVVLDAKTNKQIGLSCSNFKSRQEKIKNNRSLGDLVLGSNKDHKTYREKTLRNDIALDLSGDVGRRVWVPITKRIRKSLK